MKTHLSFVWVCVFSFGLIYKGTENKQLYKWMLILLLCEFVVLRLEEHKCTNKYSFSFCVSLCFSNWTEVQKNRRWAVVQMNIHVSFVWVCVSPFGLIYKRTEDEQLYKLIFFCVRLFLLCEFVFLHLDWFTKDQQKMISCTNWYSFVWGCFFCVSLCFSIWTDLQKINRWWSVVQINILLCEIVSFVWVCVSPFGLSYILFFFPLRNCMIGKIPSKLRIHSIAFSILMFHACFEFRKRFL